MKNKIIPKNTLPVIFEENEVRRVCHEEQCFFVVEDVIQTLIESVVED
jgi:prophage antirepressor-like protein